MATLIGLSGSNKIVKNRSIVTEEIGIQRYIETFTTTSFGAGIGPTSTLNEGSAVPAIYSQSTRFSFMNVENISIREMPGDLAEVTVNYVGFTYPILFSWPPTTPPTIASSSSTPTNQSSIPQFSAISSRTTALVRCSPAGQEGRDFKHYPLQVEIEFIDSVANEFKLLSTWKIGSTPMPTSFRGIAIPPPTRAPYRERPINEFQEGEFLVYKGVVLKGLNVVRRGNRYNQIRATFSDDWFIETVKKA